MRKLQRCNPIKNSLQPQNGLRATSSEICDHIGWMEAQGPGPGQVDCGYPHSQWMHHSNNTQTSSKFSITSGLPRASWGKKQQHCHQTHWSAEEDVSSQLVLLVPVVLVLFVVLYYLRSLCHSSPSLAGSLSLSFLSLSLPLSLFCRPSFNAWTHWLLPFKQWSMCSQDHTHTACGCGMCSRGAETHS